MTYVRTPEASRFGGLILPAEAVQNMIATEARTLYGGGAYASVRRDNKLTADWSVTTGSAEADQAGERQPLTWQARDLDRNNAVASGALDTIVDNVVSTGLRPQSSIDREILGLTDAQASALQRQFERYFFLWADSKNSDATRQATFWEAQALVLLNTLLSGDMSTLRRYKERPGALFGTCLQFVEADQMATPIGMDTPEGRIWDGVECDDDGEPIRYHYLVNHPGDLKRKPGTSQTDYTAVPAYDSTGVPMVLHHYNRRRPGQRRGVSVFAPVIELFKQMGRYTEARITTALTASLFSVFIKKQAAGAPILPGMVPGQVGAAPVVPAGTGLTRLQSGMIMDLAPGEEVDFASPPQPNGEFEQFVEAVWTQVGVSLGLPREVMLKHFASSYSASRAAILEAWKTFRRRRAWLIASLCQPTYEWVIAEAVARGYVSAPGFFTDPLRRAAYLGTTWRGIPMGQIDPLKEAKAAKEWLSMPGLTTVQQVAAEQFGTDYEDNLDQTRRERTQIADLPADPMAPPAPAVGSAPAGPAAVAASVVEELEARGDA